jgi:hypothetical protein
MGFQGHPLGRSAAPMPSDFFFQGDTLETTKYIIDHRLHAVVALSERIRR